MTRISIPVYLCASTVNIPPILAGIGGAADTTEEKIRKNKKIKYMISFLSINNSLFVFIVQYFRNNHFSFLPVVWSVK